MNVYILLDRSGSMATLWTEALGSINGYVEKLKPKTNVHVAVFDSVSHDVIRDCKAEGWDGITNEDATPRGGTPLYDSCGKIMAVAEEADAKKTILVVMTDGYENASHEYNQTAIKAKVAQFEKNGWEVVFLGANFDAVEQVSGSVGVVGSKTMNIAAGNMRSSMDTLMSYTTAYAATGAAINFTEADKLQASTKI